MACNERQHLQCERHDGQQNRQTDSDHQDFRGHQRQHVRSDHDRGRKARDRHRDRQPVDTYYLVANLPLDWVMGYPFDWIQEWFGAQADEVAVGCVSR